MEHDARCELRTLLATINGVLGLSISERMMLLTEGPSLCFCGEYRSSSGEGSRVKLKLDAGRTFVLEQRRGWNLIVAEAEEIAAREVEMKHRLDNVIAVDFLNRRKMRD